MFKRMAVFILILIMISMVIPTMQARPERTIGNELKNLMNELSFKSGSHFIQNVGQLNDDRMSFYSADKKIYFARDGVYMDFRVSNGDEQRFEGIILKYGFVGGNNVVPVGDERCGWDSNFFFGNDPERWYPSVHNYEKVRYNNIWSGIDIVYGIDGVNLKYDIIIHPWADPNSIAFNVNGPESLNVGKDGDLEFRTRFGEIIDGKLIAFQEKGRKIECDFNLISPTVFGFKLADYDPSIELIIDPLIYSTFIGGSSEETMECHMKVDKDDNKYIGGTSGSADYPITEGCYDSVCSHKEAVITKIAPNMTILLSTYLGGLGDDIIRSIYVDRNSNIFVLGDTLSYDFPVTSSAYDKTHSAPGYLGYHDLFITKIAASGSSLIYSTFFGANYPEQGGDIIVDSNNCAIITGSCYHTLETTAGSYCPDPIGGREAFVTKFNAEGSGLIFSTFIGGSNDDIGKGLDIDKNGYIYITGYTNSNDFPTTSGAFDETYNGNRDAFVVKLNSSGDSLIYSTYLGGSDNDDGYSIVIDEKGNSYVTGMCGGGFPTTSGVFGETYSGGLDAFLVKLNNTGSSLDLSTYIGGTNKDIAYDMVLDRLNNVYLCGVTYSNDMPFVNGSFNGTFNGGTSDSFAMKMNKDFKNVLYMTYLGGSQQETAYTISLNSNLTVNVAGFTYSSDFPTTPGAFDDNYGGSGDLFFSLLEIDIVKPIAIAGGDQVVEEDSTVTFDGSSSSDETILLGYNWTFMDKEKTVSLSGMIVKYTFSEPGIYEIKLNVTDQAGNWGSDHLTVTVLDITRPVVDAGGDRVVPEDSVVILDGSNSYDNVGIVNCSWFIYKDLFSITLYGMISEYIFEDPGIYDVMLNVSDKAGNWARDLIIIKVNDITTPIPVVINYTVNEGTVLTLNASGSYDNVGIEYYNWTIGYRGRNVLLNGPTPSYLFDQPGIYNGMLMVKDKAMNSAFTNFKITVVDITAPIVVLGPDMTVNEDYMFIIDIEEISDNVRVYNITWSIWLNDGLITRYGDSIEFLIEDPGIYRLEVNVTDQAGNWATDHLNITVMDITPPQAYAGEDIILEEGQTITFDGSMSTDNVGIVNWTWILNMGSDSIEYYGEKPTITFVDVGSFTFTLKVSDMEGNEDSHEIRITVKDITPPHFDLGEDLEVYVGDVVVLKPVSFYDNVMITNWTWMIETDPVSNLYGDAVEFMFNSPGNFSVTLTVKDAEGNTASDSIIIRVVERGSPDDDEVDDEKRPGIGSGNMILIGLAIAIMAIIIIVTVVAFLIVGKKKAKTTETPPPEKIDETDSISTIVPTPETLFQKAERLRNEATQKGVDIKPYEGNYNMAISMNKNEVTKKAAEIMMQKYVDIVEKTIVPQSSAGSVEIAVENNISVPK